MDESGVKKDALCLVPSFHTSFNLASEMNPLPKPNGRGVFFFPSPALLDHKAVSVLPMSQCGPSLNRFHNWYPSLK